MKIETQTVSRTGFVWDEWFMWHNTGRGGGLITAGGWVEPYYNIEHPDTKRRIKNLMDVCGLTEQLVPIKSRQATDAELGYFHTVEYIDRIRSESKELGGSAGPYVTFGTDGFAIASRAVGALLEAVDHVLDGKVANAYALLRPPGHHAMPDYGLGGCVFGNVTIAAHHARRVRQIPRVAIVDFDVHHGNGAQHAFYADPTVLTISIHQRSWYTLKGEISERGEGEGDGANINIPLPSGSGDGAYTTSFSEVVIPALKRFRPDIVLVSAGFDAGAFDLSSSMILSSDGFRQISAMLVEAADQLCGGRIVFAHEGGYSAWATPFAVLAAIEAISGIKTEVSDPYSQFIEHSPDQLLLPHQHEVIREARAAFAL